MEGEFEQDVQPVALGCGEELAGFVGGEGFEAPGPWGAGADVAGDVARDLLLADGMLQGGLEYGVDIGQRQRGEQGTAAIRRTLQRTHAGGLITLPTKTRAAERRIALPARCLHSLKLHRELQQTERDGTGAKRPATGHVFTTPQGKPIDPTNLTRAFLVRLDKSGLRRIRFHDLRHSTATLLLEQGVELVVIKELLGHAHIGVTATVYAHVRLRLQREAIDTLSTALDGPANDEPARNDGYDSPPCGAIFR